MKLLNKILIVFFVISFLTLYGGWRFIHSEQFSKDASIKVSKILTEKFGAKLNFTAVDFSLFPLATIFKNVKISKQDPEMLDVELSLEEFEVAFTYSSFMASELEIDEVSLRNGALKLKINKKSDENINWEQLNIKEIYAAYVEAIGSLPIRLNILSAENVIAEVDNYKAYIKKIAVSLQKKKVRLKFDATDVELDREISIFKNAIKLDSANGLIDLQKDEWRVEALNVAAPNYSFGIRGKVFNQSKYLVVKASGELDALFEKVMDLFKSVPQDFLSIKGSVASSFEIEGLAINPNGKIKIEAQNVQSEWINLKNISAVIKKTKDLIIAEKIEAKNNKEEYKLLRPEAFFNLTKNKFTDFKFKLYLKNAFTNTFLFSIKDTLGDVKGHLTGVVEAFLYENRAVFTIGERLEIKDFKLVSKPGASDIFKNPGLFLEKTALTINQDYSVNIDANILMPNSNLKVVGKITEKEIDIKVADSKIDLKSFGPIAGLDLVGNGPIKLYIKGPIEDLNFNFDVDWTNFSVVDLNFGKVKSSFTLGLKELQLTIHSLEGVYNKSSYTANGTLRFDQKPGMNLKIDFQNSTFSDAKKMYHLVFKNIKLPIEPEFNFSASYSVLGGYDVNSLKIEGVIKGTDLKVVNEEAEKINLKFALNESMLNFKQIKINKSRGEVNASFSADLKTNDIDLNGSAQGLRLRDFNFYRRLNLEYDGDLFVDFDGSGSTSDFNSRYKLRVSNAFIDNVPASSSNALFYVNNDEVVTNASLLGGKVKIDSLIGFKSGIAAIKSSIDTNDVKEFLGVFSGHNVADKSITGKIKASLSTQVSLGSLGIRRFFLDIAQLNLQKGDIDLQVDSKFNSIEVDEGLVKKWDLRFKDGSEFFVSKGRNISNGVIGVDQQFAIKTSLLEILTGYVDRAVGVMKGSNQIILDRNISVKEFSLMGDDTSLKIKNLPGFITDLDYTITKKGEQYELSRLTGKYGGGEFKIGGKIFFDDLYPQINLDYKIERATIPLFKRSNVVISSNGTMIGTDLPYRLNGKVSVLYGDFLDDPTDFTKENKVNTDEYKKYLPEKDFLKNKGMLDINLSFETQNPVALKNNLAEVYIKGNGQATGDVLAPELNTRLEIVPTISKFKFKGHDFVLSQGYVEIRDRGKNRISDLKFTGLSRISEYDMKLDLSGSISKVNVDLSSEPSLSKEDLLSLLTLGVTSDMSKGLESGERRFVTTVGIGTLLVDQLKINEDLNSSLGLKLSVQPEFKEDESTLIQGKSAVSEGSTSRLKSATKIKVNKQINKKVDVSLSSTVGGSLEQKQEMNINFNINKNFSLEGVYEVKPTEDENTNTPNSLGADLKYRWSF